MQPNKLDRQRNHLCPSLLDPSTPRTPLLGLAKDTPRNVFGNNFRRLYAASGRPGKLIRLIGNPLILEQLENLNGERVVEACTHNPYAQVFCGQQRLTWKLPYDRSELTFCRHRIGIDGVRKIFEASESPHDDKTKETEVGMDLTVQDQNIATHTNANFLNKIVTCGHTMSKLDDINPRRNYELKIKSRFRTILFKFKGRGQRERKQTGRHFRNIAGTLASEAKHKLSPEALTTYQQIVHLYDRAERQQRSDTDKIYSFHEPGACCISKGMTHMTYGFGAKTSVTATESSGIIFGAPFFHDNPLDDYTPPATLSQAESITGRRSTIAICDRGHSNELKIGVTSIEIPVPGRRTKTAFNKRQDMERFLHRTTTEPIIGHLKNDHWMLRNYIIGQSSDNANLFMASADFNFRMFIQIQCIIYAKFLEYAHQLNI